MKVIVSIKLVYFILVFPLASAQSFQWAHGIGGHGSGDYISKMVTDQQGNIYITGYSISGAAFGSFISTGGFYIAKYTKDGIAEWARFQTGSGLGVGSGVSLDSQGNVYVVGHYMNGFELVDTFLVGSSQIKGFVVKYSSSGDLLWAHNLSVVPANHWYCKSVVVDKEDNIYVMGDFSNTVYFEGGSMIENNPSSSTMYSDIFIIKIDKNGEIQWAKSGGTITEDYSIDADIGPDNNIYWTIKSRAPEFTFGNTQYQIPSEASLIVSLDTDGNCNWFTTITGRVSDLDIDELGNIYATGIFNNLVDFNGSAPLTTEILGNFVVKYHSDKSIAWSKKIDNDQPHSTYISEHNGNVYIGGTYTMKVSADSLSLTASNQAPMFILKLNEIGYSQWIKKVSSNYIDKLTSISVSEIGSIAIAGTFMGIYIDFDSIRITNSNPSPATNRDWDIFIAVMDDTTSLVCPNIPLLLSGDKDVICRGEQAVFTANSNNSYSLNWYKNDQIFSNNSHSHFTTSEADLYYYVINAGTSCADTSNKILLKVIDFPEKIVSVNPRLKTCNNEPIEVKAVANSNYTYQWYFNNTLLNGETEDFITAIQSGEYKVVSVNEGLCSVASDPVSISILSPEVNFLPDTIYHCSNEAVKLSPILNSQEWNFLWSTNDTTHSVIVKEAGTYDLKVYALNCEYNDKVVVKEYGDFWIPNLITPNDDDKNDFFIIKNLNNPVGLTIYNRWGNLIYENESYLNNWSADGVESGLYFYNIKDELGCWKGNIFKGWLHVLR